MSSERRYVGIDLSTGQQDIAVRPGEQHWSVLNEEQGIGTLVSRLEGLGPALVELEATGALELSVAAALAATELPLVVVNPRQVRDFGRVTGQLAKTDRLDAQMLARFGEACRPEPRPLPNAGAQALTALLTRRRQVVATLTAEKYRLHTARPPVRQEIRRHMVRLKETLATLDADLGDTLGQSPLWTLLGLSAVGPRAQAQATILTRDPRLYTATAIFSSPSSPATW